MKIRNKKATFYICLYKRIAFTLAEVLITLGVIGVVAAITMPTLVKNYKKRLIETRLQTTLSIFNQAQKFAYIDYDAMSGWDITLSNDNFVKRYYNPYLRIVKVIPYNKLESGWFPNKRDRLSKARCYKPDGTVLDMTNNTPKYILNNGVGFFMKTNYNSEWSWNGLKIPIDLMISKNEAKYGVDYFLLRNSNKKNYTYAPGDACKLIKDNSKTDQGMTLYEHCATGEAHYYYGDACSAIIQCNGFKIPDDYPIRF